MPNRFLRRAFAALTGKGVSSDALTMDDPRAAHLWQMGGGTVPTRNRAAILRTYRTHPWFRAVTHKVASITASVPWVLYAVKSGDTGKFYAPTWSKSSDPVARAKLLDRERSAGRLKVIEQHPLLDLLDTPNPEITGRTARLVGQVWLDTLGEFPLALKRGDRKGKGGRGLPVEAWPVPPTWIVRTPTATQPTFVLSWGGATWELPREDMIWMKDPNPENPYGRGIGLAEALSDELTIDESAAKRVGAWFANGTVPDMVVSVKGLKGPALKAAREEMEARHRGVWNAFRSYWTGGEVVVNRLDTTFKDMQLVELRRWNRDLFRQVFGVPPEVMGITEDSNRANIEGADLHMAKGCTVPRLELQRTELQARLVPEFDERLILDYVSPIPEDRAFALEVMKAKPNSFTVNDARRLAGHDPVEGGDELDDSPPPIQLSLRGADPAWAKSLGRGSLQREAEGPRRKRAGGASP